MCEGTVTEVQYFRDLQRRFRGALVILDVRSPTSDPAALVSKAIERKTAAEREARSQRDQFLAYDQVWCVVDVDQHVHLPAAAAAAKRADVQMAISNPAFELWLLLHFVDHQSYIERRALTRKLTRYIPHYDKSIDCDLLHGCLPDAKTRAEHLDKHQESLGKAGENPSTAVYKLAEAIERAAQFPK